MPLRHSLCEMMETGEKRGEGREGRMEGEKERKNNNIEVTGRDTFEVNKKTLEPVCFF